MPRISRSILRRFEGRQLPLLQHIKSCGSQAETGSIGGEAPDQFSYMFKNHMFSEKKMSMAAFVRSEGASKAKYDWDEIEFRRQWRTMNATQAASKIFANNEFAKEYYLSHRLEVLPVHLDNENAAALEDDPHDPEDLAACGMRHARHRQPAA